MLGRGRSFEGRGGDHICRGLSPGSWLSKSTYLHLDFCLLLVNKRHSREICHQNWFCDGRLAFMVGRPQSKSEQAEVRRTNLRGRFEGRKQKRRMFPTAGSWECEPQGHCSGRLWRHIQVNLNEDTHVDIVWPTETSPTKRWWATYGSPPSAPRRPLSWRRTTTYMSTSIVFIQLHLDTWTIRCHQAFSYKPIYQTILLNQPLPPNYTLNWF